MRRDLMAATAFALVLFTVSSGMASTITHVATWEGVGTTPAGVDVDANGNVYVADIGGNQVLKYNSSDTLQQTMPQPRAMAY